MKRSRYGFMGLLIIAMLMLISNVNAQSGDPPPPPSQHGNSNNQPPGGAAPIGEGLLVLTIIGTIWATRKWYLKRKQKLAE